MLTSEKSALYQLVNSLGTVVNGSGWAAFFRNGNSNSVPKTFLDLVATSRCAAEYLYQSQPVASNGEYRRIFARGRSLMPMGGYGAGRVVYDPVTKQPIQTYAVYPEYVRYTLTPGSNPTPQQVMAMVSSASDHTATVAQAWGNADVMEFDYGRTLRFRSFMFANTNINLGNIRLEYQDPTTLVWTRITAALGSVDGYDVVARKLRISTNGTSSTSFISFIPYAERASDFVVASFTHVVLVPLTQAYTTLTQNYMQSQTEDYYGLVLDVGTDVTLATPAIGKYGQQHMSDLVVRIADNALENV